MSESDPKEQPSDATIVHVRCRRIDQYVPVEEHALCPYCYGKLSEIATGRHGHFCDYRPGVDPIVFGCPDDSEREARG